MRWPFATKGEKAQPVITANVSNASWLTSNVRQKMKKTDLARIQLERAMLLFVHESDYISATTLAGAAEEVLGNRLEFNALKETLAFIRRRLEHGGHQFKEKLVASELNRARNALKHYNVGDSTSIAFCLKDAAVEMIDQAVSNHVKLTGEWPDADVYLEYCRTKEAIQSATDNDGAAPHRG